MKKVAILGSTGSIGENTLKVISLYPKLFKVVALTAFHNDQRLLQQARLFKPSYVALDANNIARFKAAGVKGVRVFPVEDSHQICSFADVDIVVIAMRGAAALLPFLASVKAGKRVAPANKEALVMAGPLLMQEAKKNGAVVIPIDSEQSAIFQCLVGQNSPISQVHLTASGGPLFRVPKAKFDKMTVNDILRHPRWSMGRKITVDSATLMNKGFEVIEAQQLFNLTYQQINVVIHPQAIIHSMVEFKDGSLLAQLGITDMRLPIQYALTYPERLPTALERLDLVKLRELTFERPDTRKFPALALAFDAARRGGSLPAVLNAANEVAVDAFLEERLTFTGIYKIVEKVTTRHRVLARPSLQDILYVDHQAREEASQLIGKHA